MLLCFVQKEYASQKTHLGIKRSTENNKINQQTNQLTNKPTYRQTREQRSNKTKKQTNTTKQTNKPELTSMLPCHTRLRTETSLDYR